MASDNSTEKPAGGRTRDVRIALRTLWVLLALAVLPWVVFVLHLHGDLRPTGQIRHSGPGIRQGAWGQLRVNDLAIAPVDVLVPGADGERRRTSWVFEGYAPAKLQDLFRSLQLSGPLTTQLLDTNAWETGAGKITVHPPDEAVLALEPAARLRLYDILGASTANDVHFQPWSMKTSMFTDRLESPRFREETRDLLHRLAYVRGGRTFFSDVPVLLNQLSDPDQQLQAMRLLNSASTYQVHLIVPPGADTDDMAAYWGTRGRRKDLKPILESLAQLPRGGELDIAHLLPAFARQRLYIYPSPVLAQDGVRRDCHWTSLNFFSLVADNRFGDSTEATRHILANYYRTGETPRFGDLVLLLLPGGDCIHSAVYLAGGLAFTKNGDGLDQPWIIMDVDDLRELYTDYHHAEISVQYWREQDAPPGGSGS